MNGYGYQNNFGGFAPGVTASPQQFGNNVKVTPWLSADDINMLKKDTEQFSLAISEEELKRAMCNHREINGAAALKGNDDGTCTCLVCGHTFSITNELTNVEVTAACNVIENILQTTKLLYNSMDATTGKEFFQILAFIKKIPKLYEIASNDFKKYENVFGFNQGSQQNAFAIFGSLTNPGFGYMGMAPQYTGQAAPQYGNQMGGFAPQQPNMMPGYNTTPVNPFMQGYGQPAPMAPQYGAPTMNPAMGYQQPTLNPQMGGGFAMNPQGAAAPQPAPTAPQEPAKTEGAVNVTTEFKA